MGYRLDQMKEDAIYDWAVSSLGAGVNVIWDKPGSPRPDKPYATLNIPGGPLSVGDRVERKYKTLDTWEYNFVKKFTLSINIYADDDHLNLMQKIINGTFLDTKLEILQLKGLACWGYDGPRDLSALIETEWEFRSNIDIFISYGEAIEDIPMEIQKIEINEIDYELP
jgi:hypothetical protein